jgi:Lon protease-like protein
VSELPLFPLGSVLFPGGRLPLQIFEQRYLDLVRRCLKEDTGFGMAWILRGNEVAQPGGNRLDLGRWGTIARIVDWDALPNGLLGITIEGAERFELTGTRVEDDGLVMGEVRREERRQPVPVIPEWSSLVEVLQSLERHPHVQKLGIQADHEDAWQVGAALAQLLPVDEAIKYELLMLDTVEEFMERLDELLNQLGELSA